MNIRRAKPQDLSAIATVYETCFPGERDHELWIRSTFLSFPRAVYYVAEKDRCVAGYILWCAKNGFRQNTIVELEQVGVHPDSARQGLGRELIENSFTLLREHLATLGYEIGAVLVTTSEGHFAEGLYESALGVKRAAVIEDYGSGNEVILFKTVNGRMDRTSNGESPGE